MTSKEALERLGAEKLARGQLIRNDDKVEPYINCIKQDLDRLEQLEDNIKIHKETIKMQHNQIEKLKEKNKKLKDKVYNYQLCANITEPFHKLNKMKLKQLEKVIEILKGKICVHQSYICYDAYADIKLTDEEIELLKEYL